MDRPILVGRRVVLRPVRADDRPRLAAILDEPEVARWWRVAGEEEATAAFFGNDDEVAYAIEVDGEVVGAIQYAEEGEPAYRHAGIDLFLTAARHGQGLGSDALRTMARHLIEDRGHHRLTIDPAASNVRAIRAYRAVGFRPVGVMRRYERGSDGSWHDGLLMDLLADELT